MAKSQIQMPILLAKVSLIQIWSYAVTLRRHPQEQEVLQWTRVSVTAFKKDTHFIVNPHLMTVTTEFHHYNFIPHFLLVPLEDSSHNVKPFHMSHTCFSSCMNLVEDINFVIKLWKHCCVCLRPPQEGNTYSSISK